MHGRMFIGDRSQIKRIEEHNAEVLVTLIRATWQIATGWVSDTRENDFLRVPETESRDKGPGRLPLF